MCPAGLSTKNNGNLKSIRKESQGITMKISVIVDYGSFLKNATSQNSLLQV